ncbi:L-serine ammonia-lyase, iron-sulfur-dependent, subunit alpha [Desulfocurvus sp.]|jgi:L-cysteine desulfidase|uniref:L-cysteine desulfidase family protein n=1 Tax=Desulfocurvus sp. TaxID=2871698 RepID=UPI0025BF38FE|nr:L-serine ammonia-lyase, iron-sulfur-dependent, subunit alpha [Desulfocurvus sp.]MCK9239468.1 L-serine ammonia-lyase, iron-sulfur-dependent, subunit alpha [Desulfocurvus sp.]
MTYTIKELLRMQVAPALGCTEPVAIALAAAAAVSLLPPGPVEGLALWVDPNIYKNGLAVIIPGTGGLCGLDMAAALGAEGGDPALGLEVLEPVDDAAVARARALVDAGAVGVDLLEDHRGLYVRVCATRAGRRAEAVIEGVHDNIAALSRDGEPVADSPLLGRGGARDGRPLEDLEAWLRAQSLAGLLALPDALDQEDLDFLEQGVRHNLRLAEHGLEHAVGLGVGRALERLASRGLLGRDMLSAARILTSAAADARMGGAKLPAMSSAGSGNHGLTAILPIQAVAGFVDAPDRARLEAVALSHAVTAYVKAHTGRLSAVCGCSVAAGAGAAAGVARLLGGDAAQVAGAIKNLIEDLAGVICDGAKAGCALKLATAAGTAVQAALFAMQGVNVSHTDGIVGASPEQTMRNVGTLSTQGMVETDRTILRIMLEKRFSGL